MNEDDELSSEFLEARELVFEAERQWAALSASGDSTPERIREADERVYSLANAAWEIRQADLQERVAALRGQEVQERLDAPFEQSLARVVQLVRDEGPLTASDIEARRIPGASKNSIRTLLREAEQRGSLEQRKDRGDGRRRLWVSR